MKLFKSCNTLPIRRFYRIFDKDDYRNLIIGFDEENDTFELTSEQEIEYADIFETIYYEYSEITENFKLRRILKKRQLINNWTFLYTMITSLIDLFEETKSADTLFLINDIDEPKYHIDIEKPLGPQIKSLKMTMKGLKNKIMITKIKVAESLKNEKKSVKVDLDKDALYLEKNLELKRSIDPDVASVKRWVNMIQMSKQKAKDYAKTTNNNKRSRRGN